MEKNPLDTENNRKVGASNLREVNPVPLQPITRGKNHPNDSFKSITDGHPFDSLPKGTDGKGPQYEPQNPGIDQPSPLNNAFLIELVHSIKNVLSSIYQASVISTEKFRDPEIQKRSHNQIRNDIRRIDSVLNSLLNFITINTPIEKTNRLSIILDEILEANDKYLREKNIKILKKSEQDLPDTSIHNEQVRFILHSVIQYAILSTPRDETIGFLVKALDFHDVMDVRKDSPGKKKEYVEVTVGFNGQLTGPLENLLKRPEDQRQTTDLILILVSELLAKNRGSMTIAANGKRPNTLITLRFPIERRNVVYYAPISL